MFLRKCIILFVSSFLILTSGVAVSGEKPQAKKVYQGPVQQQEGFFKKLTKKVGGLFVFVRCGNGRVEGREQCDDGNRRNGDGCSCSCFFEPAPRQNCGNGICEIGETSVVVNGIENRAWTTNCPQDCWGIEGPPPTVPRYYVECGNCLLDGVGEECDDGNTVPRDGCSATCHQEPFCGDGRLDPGETCDDGNRSELDGCRNDCSPSRCGDGIVNMWEACDDNNAVGGDGCNALCLNERDAPPDFPECPDIPGVSCECPSDATPPSCNRNGIVEAGEECDDGNTDESDGCSGDCRNACRLMGCGCDGTYWTRWDDRSTSESNIKTDGWGNVYLFAGGGLVKFDRCGFKRWAAASGGSPDWSWHRLDVDAAGYSYMAYAGGLTREGEIDHEMHLKKYSPCGALLWEQTQNPITRGYSIQLASVKDVHLDQAGNLYVLFWEQNFRSADYKYWIHKYSSAAGTPAGPPWPIEVSDLPDSRMTVGPDGNLVVTGFSPTVLSQIILKKITPSGVVLSSFGTAGGETRFTITGPDDIRKLQADAVGNIYILMANILGVPVKIYKFNPLGIPLAELNVGDYSSDETFTIDRNGFIYLSENVGPTLHAGVSKWTLAGELLWTNTDPLVFPSPYAVTFSASQNLTVGPDGSVFLFGYFNDNHRLFIRKLTPDGVTGP